ncbi:hypothetical protein JTB14_024790 [Gonioctena quinquepunctata]|nr:hypothetical protein JTB14_024790 [Gonioctena quinquepunctata]
MIRMIGWIFRFAINSKKAAVEILGELTFEEIDRAEIRLLKSIQLETFGSNPNHLKNLQITEDKNGLWRIITKLTEGEDSYNFKYPILIPDGAREFLENNIGTCVRAAERRRSQVDWNRTPAA